MRKRFKGLYPPDAARHLEHLEHLGVHRGPVQVQTHDAVTKLLAYKQEITRTAPNIEHAKRLSAVHVQESRLFDGKREPLRCIDIFRPAYRIVRIRVLRTD